MIKVLVGVVVLNLLLFFIEYLEILFNYIIESWIILFIEIGIRIYVCTYYSYGYIFLEKMLK